MKKAVINQNNDLQSDNEEQIKAKGIEYYTFKKPLVTGDKTYKTMTFDFDSLSASDMLSIQTELLSRGIPFTGVHEMNKIYLLYVAARAAKINVKELEKASFQDATQITLLAQSFLM